MRDVKPTQLVRGCSILAKTSQGRNKILAKVSRVPQWCRLANLWAKK